MSELSYKELQEQGVFDVPYRAFEYIQSQQAKIDELEFKLSSTVNNFDNSCKTIAIYQKFLDDADVANKFLTDKIDELQARIDGATGYILNNDDIIYVKDEMIWFRDTWWFATFKNNDEIKPL